MRKNEVQIGGRYIAKVSGALAVIRIDRENPRGGWDATNTESGRAIRVKSAQRLRCQARDAEARGPAAVTMQACWPPRPAGRAIAAADQENARLRDEREAAPDGMTASERAMAESAMHAPSAAPPKPASVAWVGTGVIYDQTRCATPRCRREPAMTYLGKPLCHECWQRDCATEATTSDGGDAAVATNEETTTMPATTKKSSRSEKKAAKPKAKAKAQQGDKAMSALDAAASVLEKTGGAMNCKTLIDEMASRGLWKSPGGKTPEATLYAGIIKEISNKGSESRFKKVGRGEFVRA